MDKPPSNKVSLAYQNTYSQLVSFFRKRLDNASDATDLSHDVFTLWLKRAKQTPVEHSRAFLFKIAHRVLIDHWRAAGKQRMALAQSHEDDDVEQEAPAGADPQHLLEQQQRLSRLEEALNSLSPRRREAFLMHRFDGLSQIEVAERMGISVSMVEKHIAGALLHCKRHVAEQGSEQHDE